MSLIQESSAINAAIEKHAQYINPPFIKLLGVFGYGRVFQRALDVWIWDQQGRKYLDLLAGFGSANIGHSHPRLIAKLHDFLNQEILNFCHIGPSLHMAELGEALAKLAGAPLQISLFSNSGGEAVEAGMKLARAATKREKFIYCQGGFHGTNLGTLSIMGKERMRKPFEPLLAGCISVPFGDLDQLKQALSSHKAAGFIVEPIQCEAGIKFPPAGYLKSAQELCRRYGTLLILDEVQTGLGRVGTMFAYQGEDFVPDILVLAKALSGSLAPISATITSKEIFNKGYGSIDRFDLHSSTFGGNALCAVVALETLRIIEAENLLANSVARGQQFLAGLTDRLGKHAFIKDIRGRGLLIGIELGPTEAGLINKLIPGLVETVSEEVFGQWLAVKLLEQGVICQPASQQWNVLRLEPPLTIKEAEVAQGIELVAAVLTEYQSMAQLFKDVSGRLGSQFIKGWKFE